MQEHDAKEDVDSSMSFKQAVLDSPESICYFSISTSVSQEPSLCDGESAGMPGPCPPRASAPKGVIRWCQAASMALLGSGRRRPHALPHWLLQPTLRTRNRALCFILKTFFMLTHSFFPSLHLLWGEKKPTYHSHCCSVPKWCAVL